MSSNETFTKEQTQILSRFVSSVDSNVFALYNLPEVIKGALFSRYSRSTLGLRSLLLKEFLQSEEAGFVENFNDNSLQSDHSAVQKAQTFYDRILDGYGDDSIGELGGAHLAVENVSMLATKVIEDARIGGSPLEKSTRYVYFDQKVDGQYQFYKEPILMASAFRKTYVDCCNILFDTYTASIPILTEILSAQFTPQEGISKTAHASALRIKVLDALRGLLPAATLTNMGVFGNGRFFETLLHKLHCHPLAEIQDIGQKTQSELSKIIPSFIRRSCPSHRHHVSFAHFFQDSMKDQKKAAARFATPSPSMQDAPLVRLVDYDPKGAVKIAAALLFPHTNTSLHDIETALSSRTQEELGQILDTACHLRENRRHKSPRALERAEFCFEITADFGVFRDLQRHRILSQNRQLLTCDMGYSTPNEFIGTPLEETYHTVLEQAKVAYDTLRNDFPEEAQYVVPMAYKMRWYVHLNVRALQWLCELRSSPQGHPGYRLIAQEMARQTAKAIPAFERFFRFVDFEGYDMGRLNQEQRISQRRERLSV